MRRHTARGRTTGPRDDIDENKPTGSIRIRVETIHYFLKRYAEDMDRKRTASADINAQIAAYERQLRQQMLFDEALADLAARQQENRTTYRMLPVLTLGPAAAPDENVRA